MGPSGQKYGVGINKFNLFERAESVALKVSGYEAGLLSIRTQTLTKETSAETLVPSYYHTSLRNVSDDPKFELRLFCLPVVQFMDLW